MSNGFKFADGDVLTRSKDVKPKDGRGASVSKGTTVKIGRSKFVSGDDPSWNGFDEGGRTVHQEGSVLPRPRVRTGEWMK